MTRKLVLGTLALTGLLGILAFALLPEGSSVPAHHDGPAAEEPTEATEEAKSGVKRNLAPTSGAIGETGNAPGAPIPPVDSETWRQTKWLVTTELKNFEKKLAEAESRAGDSQAAYLDFLEIQLRIEMRRDAVASIQAGHLRNVPDSFANAADLYDGKPYLMFSTGDTGGALSGMVAVPMIRVAQIKNLRRAIAQVREAVMREFTAMFNDLSDSRRRSLRTKIESYSQDPLVPRAVMQNRDQLKWSEIGDYVSVR